MTSLQLFDYQGQNVRTVVINGEPWFVLADLCAVLEISNSRMVAQRLDEASVSQTYISSGGQQRQVTIVNESGMYEVVIRSDKPEAVTFRRWLTGEVLPQIRRTGSYGQPALTGPELMARALIEADSTIKAQAQKIGELEGPANSWEKLASVEGDLSVKDAAHILTRDHGIKIGQNRLFQWMRDKKWIDGFNRPYQHRVEQGLLTERIRSFTIQRTNGEMLAPPQLRVTTKGLQRLHMELGAAA